MKDDELRRELSRLLERVALIEERLGLSAPPAARPGAVPPTAPTAPPAARPITPPAAPSGAPTTTTPLTPPTAPPAAPPTTPTGASPTAPTAPPPITPPTTTPPLAPPTTPPTAPALRPPAPPTRLAPPTAPAATPSPAGARAGAPGAIPELPGRGSPLEVLIGGRMAAWVGAIAIVIGAGFLVKLGIDAGWWGRLPASARCLLVAGFGALLVLGGEVALRRISRAASVGLFGAGIGVLYLDALATFRFFDLLSPDVAFLLMGAVALMGFAITLRTNFRTIGVLSIVGGYLTPPLLDMGGADLVLLTYLTALLAVALGLSAVRPGPFRALRYVALGGHSAVALAWLVMDAGAHWVIAVIFMSLWWTMLLAETLAAALRNQSGIGNAVAMLLATAGFVTAGAWIIGGSAPGGPDWLGLFTGAIAVLGIAAALQFGSGLEALRAPPRHALDKLSVALWAQSGVLLAAGNALQFDGFGESVGWLALALASIEIGRRLRSRGVDVFGLVIGALALGRIGIFDWWTSPALKSVLWSYGTIVVTQWTILALLAVAALHAAAHRLRPSSGPFWVAMPVVLAAIGTLIWLGLCALHAGGLAATAGWLAGGAALLAAARPGRRQGYLALSIAVLLATGARWLVVDAIGGRLAPGWDPNAALPFLNTQMLLALAIAAAGAWATVVLRARRRARAAEDTHPAPGAGAGAGWQIAAIAGGVLLLAGLSFETDRLVTSFALTKTSAWSAGHVRQLLLTLLWTIGAAGFGGLSLLFRVRGGVRGASAAPLVIIRFAWLLLGGCAAKWLLGDTLFPAIAGDRAAALALRHLVNVQLLAGLALAGAAVALAALAPPHGRVERDDPGLAPIVDPWAALPAWSPVLASLLVLWGLTFEIDRAIGRLAPATVAALDVPPPLLRILWWTALWGAGAFAMLAAGRRRGRPALEATGCSVLALAAIAWLAWDTLAWRVVEGLVRTTVVVNLQFGVGALLAVLLGASLRVAPRRDFAAPALSLVAAIALWLGSLEIDRWFAEQPMAAQAGLSVYWALFGVMLVAVGFAWRSAPARYAGLALLTVTTGKVLLVDLATVGQIWRVISFVASGLLLVGTSVLYTKLSPRLLEDPEGERSSGASGPGAEDR